MRRRPAAIVAGAKELPVRREDPPTSLHREFERSGARFFRYRSFLPLLLLPLVVADLLDFRYVGGSHLKTELWQLFGFLVALTGLGVRAFTGATVPAGTSSSNTACQVADALNTTGMYSVVRHPLYLGNYLMWLGFLLAFLSWWMVLLVTCGFALYYERIMFAEEAFLRQKYGTSFDDWAAVTPAFLPRWRRWRPASLSFSWRAVLRREYSGFLGVSFAFFVSDVIGDSGVQGRLAYDRHWAVLLGFALVASVVLRTLRRHTKVLTVAGR